MGGGTRVLARVAVARRGGGDPGDDVGHGTYVAGIAAGRGWLDGDGTAGPAQPRYAGVAPGASLVGVKVSDGRGVSRLSDVLAGIEWAVDNRERYGIRVLNLSLSSTVAESYRTSLLDAAVELAWFKGIVVVVAAGNGGPDSDPLPAGQRPLRDRRRRDRRRRDGRDRRRPAGLVLRLRHDPDGLARPDLVAPGRRVVSTLASPDAALALAYPDRVVDGQYIRLSGTSAAAPVVSGRPRCCWQARPDLTPRPGQVAARAHRPAGPGRRAPGPATRRSRPRRGYAGPVGRANRGLAPSLLPAARLRRPAARPPSSRTAGTRPTGVEVGWDAVAWVENGWDSTWWDENGWDENGWDVTAWTARPPTVAGD